MNITIFKRAGAYLFDILVVSMIVSLLSYLPILNPNRTLYSEKYNELVNVYEQYENKEINESEYDEARIPISYELYRLNVYYVVLDVIIVLLYFGVVPYFFDGQTVGKKLFQIKIVSNDDKPLKITNYLLRTIVLNNILISVILQCIVSFISVDNYYLLYQNVNIVGYIIMYINLFMIIVRKDNRGLHDFVAGTKVKYIGYEEKKREAKIEEEQAVLISEKEIKPKKSKEDKTTSIKKTKKNK